jgi:hypothetical protein
MATAFRPEERTVPADYDAVPSGLVDRVIAGAARGEVDEGDLRRVERVAEKLLPMRLAPEQDEEVSPEELLKVAEFLQLALEFEMYNHDKKEDDLEVPFPQGHAGCRLRRCEARSA